MAKAQKTATRPARTAKKKTTALVKAAPKRAPARRQKPASGVLAQLKQATSAVQQVAQRIIGKDPDIGELGMVEVDLTPDEIAKLYADPDPDDIEVLPSGAIYLPHTWYTQRLNDAFGPGGWGLVQVATPQTGGGKTIVAAYILTVHGKPWAFAWGEHDYHEGNRNQTYGDAVEATVASAMRRCAKRRGVALNLWRRSFGREWLKENAVQVTVKKRSGETDRQWRRKDAPRLPGEQGRTGKQDVIDPEVIDGSLAVERSASSPAPTGTFITSEQQGRMARAVGRSGRDRQEVADWLKRRYGVTDSLGEIKQPDYDFIMRVIESPGKLPVK